MKILVVDGGGVFGIGPAAVLSGTDTLAKFDAFVGTSIGAAICASCACGIQTQTDVQFFQHWMPMIFKPNLLRAINPCNSKHSDKQLNMALKNIFRGRAYRDVSKPLFITAADVGQCSLKVFNPMDDGSMMLWEAVRAAVAAETYFPSWRGLADGGVFANNPSMVAVAAAVRKLHVPLEEIELLSIGTGNRAGNMRQPHTIVGWSRWLIRALLEGSSSAMHDYFVRSLPLKRYVRIQFAGESHWRMDSARSMREAYEKWDCDIKNAKAVVNAF
jgi:patatin-like phospholipase/acyl hydrolase